MQVLPQVDDTLIGEVIIMPLPVELLLNEGTRLEALHELHHVQVRNLDLLMLRSIRVLLAADDALCNNKALITENQITTINAAAAVRKGKTIFPL